MRLDTFPVQPAPGIDVDFASCERAVVAVMEKAKKQILECSAALGGLEAYHDAPACTKLRYRIRDALADMRQALGELELLHDQCSTSGTVERVGGLLRQARQEYKDLFAHGRAAIKGSKDRGDAVARRLLLEGTRGEDDELGLGMAREGARGRDALREAENQTQVLRRIRLQIAGEIERQEAAGVALGDSNQVLQKAGAEFKRQHPLLRTSHALLRALRRQEVQRLHSDACAVSGPAMPAMPMQGSPARAGHRLRHPLDRDLHICAGSPVRAPQTSRLLYA